MRRLFFFAIVSAVLFAGCKESINLELPNPGEEQQLISGKTATDNAEVRKVIDSNRLRSNTLKNGRTVAGATWYFSPYGYVYTTPGGDSYNSSVYIVNNNNFPITVTVSGQLIISNASLSASTSGCYFTQTSTTSVDVVLGPGNTGTLSLKASLRNSVAVEGFLQISQTAPFPSPIAGFSDDFLYLIRIR